MAAEAGEQGRTAVAIPVDVTRTDQVESMIQWAPEVFGRVDILVNNAGGSGNEAIQRIEDVSEEALDVSVDLNLKGMFLCYHAVVPLRPRCTGGTLELQNSLAADLLGTATAPLPAPPAYHGIFPFHATST